MLLNEKLFFPKEVVCPVCEKSFKRYALRKAQFSIAKRDIDYRPIYLGNINPRFFAVCVCPNCFYAAEDKYFCARMNEDDLRRKQYFDTHKAEWEAKSRVKAASTGQQIWKDQASEKLKELTPEELIILRKITPLLKKSAANIISKGKPYNELQKECDLEAAIRSYELAAICYKARRAIHRILGYTYLSGAWTSRDAFELEKDEKRKAEFKEFETAYLREAVAFLAIANKATNVEDSFNPDGTRILKENIPQTRIYEIMYILAGTNRLLGNIEDSNRFLEQIFYGNSNAQGIILWFVNQAREMRQYDTPVTPAEDGVPQEEDNPEDSDEPDRQS